jgi:hypothetical protein
MSMRPGALKTGDGSKSRISGVRRYILPVLSELLAAGGIGLKPVAERLRISMGWFAAWAEEKLQTNVLTFIDPRLLNTP